MKRYPLLLVCLLALQGCSLQDRLAATTANLEDKFANIKAWDNLPLRTISWNQAVAMMKKNNLEYLQTKNVIEKSERTEISIYTDLIPGVTYYSYFSRALGDMTKNVNSDDILHQVNVNFYIPTVTQIPYRVYASKAATFAAIKAQEGRERELVSKLYTLQRQQALANRKKELDKQQPNEKPDYLMQKADDPGENWGKIAALLGDYSARWQILPSSVPQFKWSKYKKRIGTLDPLVVCQFALGLEQARLSQYSVALQYLPTLNTNIYSPQLFSSSGGTYSGTFLDKEDTKINLSLSYDLDTKLSTWNRYCDDKAAYELKQRETAAKMVELKQKLHALSKSIEEYYTWRDFMHKRMEHLGSTPTANAEEFLENEMTLHSMRQELLKQESSIIEPEGALILQYGLL